MENGSAVPESDKKPDGCVSDFPGLLAMDYLIEGVVPATNAHNKYGLVGGGWFTSPEKCKTVEPGFCARESGHLAYYFDEASSTCSEDETVVCGGVGECIGGVDGFSGVVTPEICKCNVPDKGLFKGMVVLKGDGCEVIRTLYVFPGSTTAIVYVCGALTIFCGLFWLIFVFKYRRENVVRKSTPKAGYMTCVGTVLQGIAIMLSNDKSDGGCNAFFGLVTLGWIFGYAAMIAKAARLHNLFNKKGLKGYPDSHVIKNMFLWTVPQIVLEIVMLILGGYGINGVVLVTPAHDYHAVLQCDPMNPSAEILQILIFPGYMFFATCVGLYYAVKTKDVRDDFNESKAMFYAVVNNVLVMGILVPLFQMTRGGDPSTGDLLKAVALAYLAIAPVFIVYLPKLLIVLNPPDTDQSGKVMMMSNKQGSGAKSSGAKSTNISTVPKSKAEKAARIKVLEDEIALLNK